MVHSCVTKDAETTITIPILYIGTISLTYEMTSHDDTLMVDDCRW